MNVVFYLTSFNVIAVGKLQRHNYETAKQKKTYSEIFYTHDIFNLLTNKANFVTSQNMTH